MNVCKRPHVLAAVLVVLALISAACARPAPSGSGAQQPQPSRQPAQPTDLLAAVKQAGVLRVATDPNYPPQSYLDEKTGQWTGFDVDVASEIAKRLGVKLEFVTPAWDVIVAGSWQDRWDLSVGSMTITAERMQVLYFTQPYYTTPAQVFVHKDAKYAGVEQLAGKRIGVCGGCTYEHYLDGTLTMPGVTVESKIKEPQIKTYETDLYALEDLALGDGVRLDAVLTALPTGLEAIKKGMPLKPLGDPVYYEYLAAAVDRKASKDPKPFVQEVSRIIQEMHRDGTLKQLSLKHYGVDLASPAAQYQLPPQD